MKMFKLISRHSDVSKVKVIVKVIVIVIVKVVREKEGKWECFQRMTSMKLDKKTIIIINYHLFTHSLTHFDG